MVWVIPTVHEDRANHRSRSHDHISPTSHCRPKAKDTPVQPKRKNQTKSKGQTVAIRLIQPDVSSVWINVVACIDEDGPEDGIRRNKEKRPDSLIKGTTTRGKHCGKPAIC
mmetsp:Transcript_38573/g.57848  ORF Transcript_38573/g.57848 Transcript_38573/m.57848 type:complete len:111 (-) Transcript_38573:342-674(-)